MRDWYYNRGTSAKWYQKRYRDSKQSLKISCK